MSQEEFGIVLKSFLPRNKISVLTKGSGKLNLAIRPAAHMFSPGTVIKFFAKNRGERVILPSRLEVLAVPLHALADHLYWFHHILEICYYFVPLGARCTELFWLVQCCFELESKSHLFEPHFSVVKKACLVKLFLLLGVCPQTRVEPQEFEALFDRLVLASLDSANVQKVRSLRVLVREKDVKKIDTWLLRCIQEHPHAAHFKTLSFFNKI